jgi:ATP-dependent Clp protease protease subunit
MIKSRIKNRARDKHDLFLRLESCLEFGIDLDSREIWLGDLEDPWHSTLSRGIKLMESLSKDPIKIYVDSYGGGVYEALSLYDIIKASSCPTVTIGIGKVMSGGNIVLLAGDTRLAYENTTFMMHEVSAENIGRKSELEIEFKEIKRLQEKLLTIFEKETNNSHDWWFARIKNGDCYFTTEDAILFGIVHRVIKRDDND